MIKYITDEEVAKLLKEAGVAFSIGTLANMRSKGSKSTLPFHKISGKVRYKEDEVLAWIKDTQ